MSFDKVFIHVGLHKTASTFLQNNFFKNTKDVLYLTRPFTQCNTAFNKLQYADDSLYSHEEFMHEISLLPRKKVLLISDESLSGVVVGFSYVNRTMIMRRLHKAFPNAEIILFIRGQIDIINSHYNQYIKNGLGTLTIKDFIWIPKGQYSYKDAISSKPIDFRTPCYKPYLNNINIDCFKYYELALAYNALFKNVHIILFEDLKKNNRVVLNRLNKILGTNFEVSGLNSKKVNSSISDFQLSIKRVFNILFSGSWSNIPQHLSLGIVKLLPPIKSLNNNKAKIAALVGSYFKRNNDLLLSKFPQTGIDKYKNNYKKSK